MNVTETRDWDLPREIGEAHSRVPCRTCQRLLPQIEDNLIGSCPYCDARVASQKAAAGLPRITGTNLED